MATDPWKTWKKWGVSGTKRRAAQEFQKMIRYEAADKWGQVRCVTCFRSNGYKNSDNTMDAGHFVGSRTNAVLFVEDNCHPQCVRCNKFLSGNQEVYSEFMVRTYGQERVTEIRNLRFQTVSFTAKELDVMRREYRERWKAAEKRIKEGKPGK